MPKPDESLLGDFAETTYDTWRAEVERALNGGDFQKKLVTRTIEGIDVQPLYTEADWPGAGDPGGFAGAPPYRRGAEAEGRHGERWDMRPRYDNPDPSVLKREIAADLSRGARSLWLCFDAQVRGGRASAEPPRGAQEGVPCVSAAQLSALLDDVLLEAVTLSLDAGANALAVAGCFAQAVAQRGLPLEKARALFNADPLAALARDGQLPFSLDSARLQLTQLAEFTVRNAPSSRAVTVSVVPYHDAGAHAGQEIGFALATGVAYLRWLTEAGLDLQSACSQIAFSVAVGSDFFIEVAKLRALRKCWANAVAACGGGAEEQRCTIHALTSTRTKTQRDPWVNMLRETSEAFAAAVGGADAVTTGGFDRAARSLGRVRAPHRRQHAGDPGRGGARDAQSPIRRGGAWYIEMSTDRLAEAGWQGLQAIEAAGRYASKHCARVPSQRRSPRSRANAPRASPSASSRSRASVSSQRGRGERRARRAGLGCSCERSGGGAGRDVQGRIRGQGVEQRAQRGSRARRGCDRMRRRRGADLGQLSCALSGPGAGETVRTASVAPRCSALRTAARRVRRRTRSAPASDRACSCATSVRFRSTRRARSSRQGFFNAGGLRWLDNDGFATQGGRGRRVCRSGAALCVVCGSDDAYAEWVEALAPLLARAAPSASCSRAVRAPDARSTLSRCRRHRFRLHGHATWCTRCGDCSTEIGVVP